MAIETDNIILIDATKHVVVAQNNVLPELDGRNLTDIKKITHTIELDGDDFIDENYNIEYDADICIVGHNIGYRPICSLLDKNGCQSYFPITHINNSQFKIYFTESTIPSETNKWELIIQ